MKIRLGIAGAVGLCVTPALAGGGLKSASAQISSADSEMKELGEACTSAETEWKQACKCDLNVMFDLTPPKYTHHRLFNDDQHLLVKHVCEGITEDIKRVCTKQASAMCKLSTLNLKRVDVDQLVFTMSGATGNGQLNWDDYHTNTDQLTYVLTCAIQ